MYNEKIVIFIVGVGRSGTSLLQSMLASHPLVTFAPETSFLRRQVFSGRFDNEIRRSGIKGGKKLIDDDYRIQRIDLSLHSILKKIIKKSKTRVGARFYNEIMSVYSSKSCSSIIGEKDPRLIEYIPALSSLMPEAHVVHIIRDPRDVLASRKKAEWSAGRSTWQEVMTCRTQLIFGRRYGKKYFGDKYHEIRYENLVASPKDNMKKLCKELGISYDSSMLKYMHSAKGLVASDSVSWHDNLNKPIMRSNFGKWASSLSLYQAALCEFTCSIGFINDGKIDRWQATSKISKVKMISVAFSAIFVFIMDLCYRIIRYWRNYYAVNIVKIK